MSEPEAESWRCRHGWHSWRFVSMTDRREVTVPPFTAYICTLTQQCRRCGLRHVMSSAPVPKRVRT